FGAKRPRLPAQIPIVEARYPADRVEEELPAHRHQLGIADVAATGEIARVDFAEHRERLPLVAGLVDVDARPGGADLTFFAAPKHEQDAATKPDHGRVLAVQAVRVDDALVSREIGGSFRDGGIEGREDDQEPDHERPPAHDSSGRSAA